MLCIPLLNTNISGKIFLRAHSKWANIWAHILWLGVSQFSRRGVFCPPCLSVTCQPEKLIFIAAPRSKNVIWKSGTGRDMFSNSFSLFAGFLSRLHNINNNLNGGRKDPHHNRWLTRPRVTSRVNSRVNSCVNSRVNSRVCCTHVR